MRQLSLATAFVLEWADKMRRFSLRAQQRTQVAARWLRNDEALGRLAMIELEHALQALAADDLTIRLADVVNGIDEFIVESLVVSLGVIVFNTAWRRLSLGCGPLEAPQLSLAFAAHTLPSDPLTNCRN